MRYFKMHPHSVHKWVGLVEVLDADAKSINYIHHRLWPVRDSHKISMTRQHLDELIRDSKWLEIQLDLAVAEGL